jgi:hypothetical protein
MFFLRTLCLSSFWLSLSIGSVLVAQWLEKLVANWLGDTFKLLFTNKDSVKNYIWDAIWNSYSILWADITGIFLIDIIINPSCYLFAQNII